MPPDVGSTPQLEAPTLASLYRQMVQRPTWQTAENTPLEVDGETYERAFSELREVLEKQGRLPVAAGWINQRNFLLYGCPVVIAA